MPDYTLREANSADLETIVAFTLEEAREAEDADVNLESVRRGIAAAFTDPPLARYWVAEAGDGRIVGSTSVVTEWSDFHGGHYWWVQSVFIVPEHRGQGLLELLLEHLVRTARQAGALDLRLYVHDSNERAVRAYRRCGFTDAPYLIMRRSLHA
jgi:GNAT superfamily N-acetyltransferase